MAPSAGSSRVGRARAVSRSRSTALSTASARRSSLASSSSVSPAWTRPRWRSGRVRSVLRMSAPSTGSPMRAMPSSTSLRWRSLATLFSTTPATAMRGSYRAQPSATAAADCAWPETSSTRTTGQPNRAAMSALAPVRPISWRMPSKRPMEPSAMTRSASLAAPETMAPRRGLVMAKLSRLKLGAPVAAAWKAESM